MDYVLYEPNGNAKYTNKLTLSFIFYFLFFIFMLFPIPFHIFFHILCVVWNTLFSEETATVLGYEEVILDADAAKVLVGFQEFEVDEVLAMAF